MLELLKKSDFSELNNKQREAAETLYGPLLCIAGAGTGKTKTIIYRVANLIKHGIDPESILLLTFTKNAAQNMLNRASLITGNQSLKVSGGTYHSFAASMLREYATICGISTNFFVLDETDTADMLGAIKSNIKKFKDIKFPDKKIITKIYSRACNTNLTIEQTLHNYFRKYEHLCQPFNELLNYYQSYKKQNLMLDYDDLLLYFYNFLETNNEFQRKINDRYKFIMADEYQDTNYLQNQITLKLAEQNKNIMVVGDDSQSIYSFRGAQINNISQFPKRFKNCTIIKLEENYRSTGAILNSANKLMEKASECCRKNLYTSNPMGCKPVLVKCQDENQQSVFILSRIIDFIKAGVPLNEIAVLFRNGDQSTELELQLSKAQIPFIKWGGSNFTDSKHIKDFIAYFRVILQPQDKPAWIRILTLTEGIGESYASRIFNEIINSANPYDLTGLSISDTLKQRLSPLSKMLTLASKYYTNIPLRSFEIISDFYSEILLKNYDDGKKRIKDIDKLALIADSSENLQSFLTEILLNHGGSNNSVKDKNAVILSTVHSAKGMEWEAVFVMSALNGLFPSFTSMKDENSYAEERRLMYVALTRAKKYLTITYPAGFWDKKTNSVLYEVSDFIRFISPTLDIWQIEA